MPLSFSTLKDSKIYQLFTESEILLEFTEPHSDYITNKDNSMPTFSTTPHGLYSQLIRNQLSKKLETKMLATRSPHSHTQESTTLSRSTKLPFSPTLESGDSNTSPNTMLSPQTCSFHLTRPHPKRVTSTLLPRFLKFLN